MERDNKGQDNKWDGKKRKDKKRVRIVGWQSSSFRHYPSSYSHRHYRCCLLQSFSDLSLFIPWWMRRSSCVHACDNTACWTYGGRGHTVHLCIMHQGETASASAIRHGQPELQIACFCMCAVFLKCYGHRIRADIVKKCRQKWSYQV